MSGHANPGEWAKKMVGAGRIGDPHQEKVKKRGALSRAFPKIVMKTKTPSSPPAGETPTGEGDACGHDGEAGATFGTTPQVYQGKIVKRRSSAALPLGATDVPRGVDSPAGTKKTSETSPRPTGENSPLSDGSWTSSAGESETSEPPAANKSWRRPKTTGDRPKSPAEAAPRVPGEDSEKAELRGCATGSRGRSTGGR